MRYYASEQERMVQFRFKEHRTEWANNHQMHVAMHMHRSAEILYVRSGQICLTIFGKTSEVITPGHAALIFPYQPHEYTRADKTEYFRFNFDSTIVNGFFKPNGMKTGASAVFDVDTETIAPFLSTIHGPPRPALYKVKSFLYSMIGDFCAQIELRDRGVDDDVLSRAIDFMMKQKHTELPMAAVSLAIGCSQKSLSRAISSATGLNYTTLLSLLRVDEGRALLRETDKTILEISELCGFRSERNFYRQFKDMTGMTPREYRKSNQFGADTDIIIV